MHVAIRTVCGGVTEILTGTAVTQKALGATSRIAGTVTAQTQKALRYLAGYAEQDILTPFG
jgi:hypothetical protein